MAVILVLRAVAALLKTKAAVIVQHPPLDRAELADLQGQAYRLRAVAIRLEAEVTKLEAEAEILAVEMTLEAVSALATRPPLAQEIPATTSLSATLEKAPTAKTLAAGPAAKAIRMAAVVTATGEIVEPSS